MSKRRRRGTASVSSGAGNKAVNLDLVVSTGSTLLDLAISGTKRRGGGIPGGILLELFGESGAGKTALMSEILGFAQVRGGEIMVYDPEGRLDKEYFSIYGGHLDEKIYDRPKTIVETFERVRDWLEDNLRSSEKSPINACGTDSIAALTTQSELDGNPGLGARARDFSEELRKIAVELANSGNLLVMTNQMRVDIKTGRKSATGGNAPAYYASLRIKMIPFKSKTITKKIKYSGESGKKVEYERPIGVFTNCSVIKSSVDVPFREAPIYIMFGYGIDDVRANLQFLKDYKGTPSYPCPNGKRFMGMEQAIACVEEYKLEKQLKEEVIDLWEYLQKATTVVRQPKVRK